MGGTPPWIPPSDVARGYPTSGTPPVGPGQGVPHLRYPQSDLAGGTLGGAQDGVPPCRGTPPARSNWGGTQGGVPLDTSNGGTQGGVPPPGNPPARSNGYTPIRPGWGVPRWGGTPPQVPPHQTWPTSYRITDGVLDTPQSVCLLRSRRRTVLFILQIQNDHTSKCFKHLQGYFLSE